MEAIENRYKGQKKHIIEWLRKGKAITPMQALNRFGCFRLAAVIHVLRGDGFNIVTENVTVGGKTFGRYTLKVEEEQLKINL